MLHVSKVESYKDDTINFSVMLRVNLHSLQLLQNLMTALLMVTKHSSRHAAYLNKYEILEDVPGGLQREAAVPPQLQVLI